MVRLVWGARAFVATARSHVTLPTTAQTSPVTVPTVGGVESDAPPCFHAPLAYVCVQVLHQRIASVSARIPTQTTSTVARVGFAAPTVQHVRAARACALLAKQTALEHVSLSTQH